MQGGRLAHTRVHERMLLQLAGRVEAELASGFRARVGAHARVVEHVLAQLQVLCAPRSHGALGRAATCGARVPTDAYLGKRGTAPRLRALPRAPPRRSFSMLGCWGH